MLDNDSPGSPGRGLNGIPRSLAVQSDGTILVGGEFTSANGISRTAIARLHSDGSLDTGFNLATSGNTYWDEAITIQPDGRILLGGSFTRVGGQNRNRIGRLNANGSLDATFAPPGGASDVVHQMLLTPTNKILVVGAFTSVNGVARNRLARLNADGTLDPAFDPGTGANNAIWAAAARSDGRIILSGAFTTMGAAALASCSWSRMAPNSRNR